MKHTNSTWSINELIDKRSEINPKPQYQRTPVWTIERKALLIDSILRGYDLPKFYVRIYPNGSGFKFEVADGQQRMRTIWEFFESSFSLPKDTIIDSVNISNQLYSELPKNFQRKFLDHDLAFTEIYEARPGEINELFKRLQRGVSLNPPELRHAMYSEIGFYTNSFLEKTVTKEFFEKSGIQDVRFKLQEYIDNVVALVHFDNKRDLKATLMSQLYIDFQDAKRKEFKSYFDSVEVVLKKMTDLNYFKKGIFKNKWGFVDFFWFFYRNLYKLNLFDNTKFAEKLIEFETERLKYNSEPEKLLKLKRVKFGKEMYQYIQAFNKEGAKKENIQIRANIIDSIFGTL